MSKRNLSDLTAKEIACALEERITLDTWVKGNLAENQGGWSVSLYSEEVCKMCLLGHIGRYVWEETGEQLFEQYTETAYRDNLSGEAVVREYTITELTKTGIGFWNQIAPTWLKALVMTASVYEGCYYPDQRYCTISPIYHFNDGHTLEEVQKLTELACQLATEENAV